MKSLLFSSFFSLNGSALDHSTTVPPFAENILISKNSKEWKAIGTFLLVIEKVGILIVKMMMIGWFGRHKMLQMRKIMGPCSTHKKF